jgi:predicted transcriptional regulator of viral defense system
MQSPTVYVLRTYTVGDLMKIEAAIALEIGALNQSIITSYQLGRIIFALYQAKSYQGKPIAYLREGSTPNRARYRGLLKELEASGVLSNSTIAKHPEVFSVLAQDTLAAEEIACCIDPFCYVSHLSAMDYHGLTDRLPKILFLSGAEPAHWKKLAVERMKKDLGESFDSYLETELPTLRRFSINKIARKTISLYATKNFDAGAYIKVQGRSLRVSSIGRTFLDMIRHPSLCGGIYHVLEAYSENAARYLRLIVDEVQQHGTIIDKVRVGYILEERIGLTHPTIETWLENVQRGGSRKLVAENPYTPTYSEKWGLSINIEEIE